MSYLDSVLNVQVSATTRAIRQRGFGKPMFLAVHDYWTDRYREFGDPSELVTAGVPTDHPIYLWATTLKAQEPSPPSFGIGRRTRKFTQSVSFTPETPENGKVYSVDVDGVTVTYTADGNDTVDDVIDGLLAAGTTAGVTDPVLSGQASAPFTTMRALAGTAGDLHSFTNIVGMTVQDATANPGSGGIASDFAAVLADDSSWYCVCVDSQSKAEVAALASSVEAAKKELFFTSMDSECLDANDTDDIASALQTAGYARVVGVYHPKPLQYFAAAMAGRQLPKAPGSTNFAWQAAFSGVDYYALTESEMAALDAKCMGHYTDFGGQGYGVLLYGQSPSGAFIDVTNFCDWMRVRMQERLFLLFVNAEKVGQTALGISMIENQVRAQIAEGIAAKGLDPDFETVYDIPEIADISLADLAARKASGFRVRHRLAGAFNKVDPLTFTLTL